MKGGRKKDMGDMKGCLEMEKVIKIMRKIWRRIIFNKEIKEHNNLHLKTSFLSNKQNTHIASVYSPNVTTSCASQSIKSNIESPKNVLGSSTIFEKKSSRLIKPIPSLSNGLKTLQKCVTSSFVTK